MGLYIEREGSPITFEEWLEYVSKDNELTLSEVGTVINPLTKTNQRIVGVREIFQLISLPMGKHHIISKCREGRAKYPTFVISLQKKIHCFVH